MTDLQCKVGLLRDGWVEDDTGMWYHPREDELLTIGEAHHRQTSYDLMTGRQACFWVLALVASFYGILILIAKWNYICELLDI